MDLLVHSSVVRTGASACGFNRLKSKSNAAESRYFEVNGTEVGLELPKSSECLYYNNLEHLSTQRLHSLLGYVTIVHNYITAIFSGTQRKQPKGSVVISVHTLIRTSRKFCTRHGNDLDLSVSRLDETEPRTIGTR